MGWRINEVSIQALIHRRRRMRHYRLHIGCRTKTEPNEAITEYRANWWCFRISFWNVCVALFDNCVKWLGNSEKNNTNKNSMLISRKRSMHGRVYRCQEQWGEKTWKPAKIRSLSMIMGDKIHPNSNEHVRIVFPLANFDS